MAIAATWLISLPPKPLEVPLSTRSEKAENYFSRISLQLELSMWPGPSQADVLRQDSRGESEGWRAGSSRETCSWGKGIGSTGAAVFGDRGSEAAGVLLGQSLWLGITPHSCLCPSPSQECRKLSKPCGIQFSALASQ